MLQGILNGKMDMPVQDYNWVYPGIGLCANMEWENGPASQQL